MEKLAVYSALACLLPPQEPRLQATGQEFVTSTLLEKMPHFYWLLLNKINLLGVSAHMCKTVFNLVKLENVLIHNFEKRLSFEPSYN